jgi:SET domain-containing protein 6
MELFPPETWAKHYSLDMFHMMGSRILSRSFSVEPWHSTDADTRNDEDDLEEIGDSPQDSNLVEESDEEEDTSCIAMVPMADMLNARFGTENVSDNIYRQPNFKILMQCQSKLFHEETCLRMVTTGPIKSGDQIVHYLCIICTPY